MILPAGQPKQDLFVAKANAGKTFPGPRRSWEGGEITQSPYSLWNDLSVKQSRLDVFCVAGNFAEAESCWLEKSKRKKSQTQFESQGTLNKH